MNVSGQSELRISIYIRNGEGAAEQNVETERDRETDPISEGLSPLPHHGGQGPEGKPFSHLGRRSRKKKEEGGSLPLASGGTGVPPGAIIITAIYTNTSTIFTNNFTAIITNSSPSMQRCNPSFTRCNLYLNMVLNAIYYFQMMYGYHMMFD